VRDAAPVSPSVAQWRVASGEHVRASGALGASATQEGLQCVGNAFGARGSGAPGDKRKNREKADCGEPCSPRVSPPCGTKCSDANAPPPGALRVAIESLPARLPHSRTPPRTTGPVVATPRPPARSPAAPGMANPPPPERTAKCLTPLNTAGASHRIEGDQ
jgi:hypothetical protein